MILHMHNLYESLGRRERPQPGAPCRAEAFLGCSRFVLEREKDRLGRGAGLYRVVYNGVDAARYQPLWERPDLALAARRRWGVPEDAATVLFAGKLRESKGVHILLAAMEQVWPAMPQAALVLVGGTEFGRGRTMRETPFLRQFREQVAQTRGRVIMTGFVPPDEMPQAYLLGDVFAGPSQIEEGLGLVFLEAAAAGLPVIASRQGGIPEVVAHGDTGLLIKEKDNVPELAAAILQLLRDAELRQTMGRRGRDRVVRHFTWERAAHTLEQLYDEISSL
jgi:glycosyltransferase involved in cell wall biosynthesis